MPALIASGVILLVCTVRCLQLGFFEHFEKTTYDLRVRQAVKSSPPVATNLGFVEINDESAVKVLDGSVGFHFGLLWPRQVYGRLVEELAAQGAKAVAIDVIFAELRPFDPLVRMTGGAEPQESDEFFAYQMRRAGNVILAATTNAPPPALFFNSALAPGDVVTEPAETLRRAKAFRLYRRWHVAFAKAEANPDYGVHLDKVLVEPRRIILQRASALGDITVPLDQDGNFDVADFFGDKLPAGMARRAKPFTDQRVWHMGVVLGAQELDLDLARADIDLKHGRITLRGPGGVKRTIPVDAEGCFYIDWCMEPNHPKLARAPIQDLLLQNYRRLKGETNNLPNPWAGKLVVVGSTATGRNLSDLGATPLSEHTVLASEHWNVANSIITGRFVRRAPLAVELALITLLGIMSAVLTWKLRALLAFGMVLLVALGYIAFGVVLYVQTRYWMPFVLPVLGCLLMTHLCLVTWRVVFEQAEQRRVKSIFSRIVSPKIVNELLQAESLALGGARREVTVFFADVRGFTALADSSQERAEELVRKEKLTSEAAEACFDEQARETLETVNLYLGLVADTVIQADGTWDKFIGDCVMAFWGAPTPNPKHALACVQAAIAAQRAVYALNQQRAEENHRRELENLTRIAAGLPPKPMLPILLLGSGINSGMATVGLMGSQSKQQNYTVFGHQVNLASRLESASGRGRIFIGPTTYEHLLRDDPALAATCSALPAQNLKGISAAVTVYEVPWRPPGASPFDEEFSTAQASDNTSITGFIRRG
jgi:adenylate cyclase